jgi:hypothetical protein
MDAVLNPAKRAQRIIEHAELLEGSPEPEVGWCKGWIHLQHEFQRFISSLYWAGVIIMKAKIGVNRQRKWIALSAAGPRQSARGSRARRKQHLNRAVGARAARSDEVIPATAYDGLDSILREET